MPGCGNGLIRKDVEADGGPLIVIVHIVHNKQPEQASTDSDATKKAASSDAKCPLCARDFSLWYQLDHLEGLSWKDCLDVSK